MWDSSYPFGIRRVVCFTQCGYMMCVTNCELRLFLATLSGSHPVSNRWIRSPGKRNFPHPEWGHLIPYCTTDVHKMLFSLVTSRRNFDVGSEHRVSLYIMPNSCMEEARLTKLVVNRLMKLLAFCRTPHICYHIHVISPLEPTDCFKWCS
jgi:hypothetical protein